MNRCAYQPQQQKALVGLGCVGDIRRGLMTNYNGVVCPKPRRIIHTNDPISFRPSRLFHANNQQFEAGGESKAGTELLDIILAKGEEYGASTGKSNFQVAFSSSPPFFSGSPPTRASNPVIQDEQFGNNSKLLVSPVSPSIISVMDSPSSRTNGGGGCVRGKFGHSPAAPVRIEGFNCRRNCSISAVA